MYRKQKSVGLNLPQLCPSSSFSLLSFKGYLTWVKGDGQTHIKLSEVVYASSLTYIFFFFQWKFIIVQLEALTVLSVLEEKIWVISAFGVRVVLAVN